MGYKDGAMVIASSDEKKEAIKERVQAQTISEQQQQQQQRWHITGLVTPLDPQA